MFELVLDVLSLVCLVGAAAFSLAAGLGLLRFSDALSRLHAATKPQIFGLLLVIMAIALHDRSWLTLFALLPVFVFQSLTAPIGAHMIGRAAYRMGQIDTETVVLDELAPAIERSDELA
jgi:multicomponent Na+:H+ antiporter subunit G